MELEAKNRSIIIIISEYCYYYYLLEWLSWDVMHSGNREWKAITISVMICFIQKKHVSRHWFKIIRETSSVLASCLICLYSAIKYKVEKYTNNHTTEHWWHRAWRTFSRFLFAVAARVETRTHDLCVTSWTLCPFSCHALFRISHFKNCRDFLEFVCRRFKLIT